MQIKWYVGSTLLIAIALSGIAGCNPAPTKNESSVIRIRAPGQQKVGSLAALPVGRKACYGINVTGPGIPGTGASSCHPETGIIGGFVEGNSNLEVTVPYGSDRKLQLFVYLLPGPTGSCPSFNSNFPPSQLVNTYYVGGVSSFNISSPETNLSITATFPGETNNYAVEKGYASSCLGVVSLPNENNFFIGTAAGESTEGTTVMKARVGRAIDGPKLTNGSITLQVK